jgi:hypothetical protein
MQTAFLLQFSLKNVAHSPWRGSQARGRAELALLSSQKQKIKHFVLRSRFPEIPVSARDTNTKAGRSPHPRYERRTSPEPETSLGAPLSSAATPDAAVLPGATLHTDADGRVGPAVVTGASTMPHAKTQAAHRAIRKRLVRGDLLERSEVSLMGNSASTSPRTAASHAGANASFSQARGAPGIAKAFPKPWEGGRQRLGAAGNHRKKTL